MLDQKLALGRHIAVDVLEVAVADPLEQLVFGLGPEGVIALQHHVEEDAHRPHVRVDGHVVLLGDDLGGHVRGSPAESVNRGRRLRLEAESEIDQLQILVPVQQDVLGLDIAVHDVHRVQVVEGLGDCLEELLGLGFGQSVFGLRKQVIVQRVCAAVFQDQVDLVCGLDCLDELGDHRVVQDRQNIYLALQVLYFIDLVKPLLLIDLDRNLLPSPAMIVGDLKSERKASCSPVL